MGGNITFEDEFMTDEEIIAEFGSEPLGDEFLTNSDGGIFEKLEAIVEEVDSGGETKSEEVIAGELRTESNAVADEPETDSDAIADVPSMSSDGVTDMPIVASDGVVDVPVTSIDTAADELITSSDALKKEEKKGSSTTGSIYSEQSGKDKKTKEPEEYIGVRSKALSTAHASVQEKMNEFLNTRRKFGFISLSDYPEVASVKEAINTLINLLDAKIPQNEQMYAVQLETICIAYDELIKRCNNCKSLLEDKRANKEKELAKKKKSGKKKPLSDSDESFLKLSSELIPEFEKELGQFKIIKGIYISSNSVRKIQIKDPNDSDKHIIKDIDSWTDVLYSIRTEGLNVIGESIGGKTSSLLPVRDRDGKERFVKIEEKVARTEKEAIAMDSLDINGGDKKRTEFTQATGVAKIRGGMTISDRNVSSSRVAQRLGLEDTVAESKTIIARDAQGKAYRANSMEAIKNAMTMFELSRCVKQPNHNLYQCKVEISGNAAKQLFELQVFDLITGQIDRHANNFMALYEHNPETKTVLVTKIKAIDNDLSFGELGEKEVNTGIGDRMNPLSDHMGQDGKERFSIPFISKVFYDRLMTPGIDLVMRYDQLDLRSQPEINALIKRFVFIQNQIRDLVSRGKLKVLENEDEWEKEYRERLAEWEKGGTRTRSYLSQALGLFGIHDMQELVG